MVYIAAQQSNSILSSSSSTQRRRTQTTLGLAICFLALHNAHADTVTHQCVPFPSADTLIAVAFIVKRRLAWASFCCPDAS